MRLSGVLLLFLTGLLLFPETSLAATGYTQQYSGWVGDEKQVSTAGSSYTIKLSSLETNYSSIGVTVSPEGLSGVISKGDCNYFGSYSEKKVCYLNSKEASELVSGTYEFVPYAQITINTLDWAYISLAKTVGKTTLYLNENTTVKITLKNTGGVKAQNIVLEEELPLKLSVLEKSSVLSLQGNKLMWTGELLPGNEVSFEYKVKLTEPLSATINSRLAYFNGNKDIETYAGSYSLKTATSGSFSKSLAKSTIEVADNTTLNITIKNEGSAEKLKVNYVDMEISPSLKIIAIPENATYINAYFIRWTGVVSEAGEQKIGVVLQGKYAGTHPVTVSYETEEGGVKNTVPASTLSLKVTEKGMKLTRTISATELKPNQKASVDVYLENPAVSVMKNIVAEESFMDYSNRTVIEKIKSGEKKLLFRYSAVAPSVAEKTSYNAYTLVNYEDEFRTSHNTSNDRVVTVSPFVPKIEVTASVSPSKIYSGDYVTLKTTVKNSGETPFNDIEISDEIPSGFTLKSRTSSRKSSLLAGKTFVYTVYLEAPVLDFNAEYIVPVTIEYIDGISKYQIEKNMTVKVNALNPLLSVEKTLYKSKVNRGEFMDVKIYLKNKGDKRAENITLVESGNPEFDFELLGKEWTTPFGLNPSESLTINTAESIRGKKVGKFTLSALAVIYYNDRGIEFTASSNTPSVEIASGSLEDSALLIEKNTSAGSYYFDSEIIVDITVSNIGGGPAAVRIVDALPAGLEKSGRNFTWEGVVEAGEEKKLIYTIKPEKRGSFELGKAVASYITNGRDVSAYSNGIEIKVVSPCGDGVCSEDESKETCCSDCGCSTGYECVTNKCESIDLCGNGVCDYSETYENCVQDCPCKENEFLNEGTGKCEKDNVLKNFWRFVKGLF